MGDAARSIPLHIRWDEGLSLVHGEGTLPGCPAPRVGMPLTEALGVDAPAARALDQAGRSGGKVEFVRAGPSSSPRWLRIHLAHRGPTVEAGVHDLNAL